MRRGTITHGDFHMGNVVRNSDRTVVTDWGLAAIGHPLFDLPAWPSWDEQGSEDLAPILDERRSSLDERTRARERNSDAAVSRAERRITSVRNPIGPRILNP